MTLPTYCLGDQLSQEHTEALNNAISVLLHHSPVLPEHASEIGRTLRAAGLVSSP